MKTFRGWVVCDKKGRLVTIDSATVFFRRGAAKKEGYIMAGERLVEVRVSTVAK